MVLMSQQWVGKRGPIRLQHDLFTLIVMPSHFNSRSHVLSNCAFDDKCFHTWDVAEFQHFSARSLGVLISIKAHNTGWWYTDGGRSTARADGRSKFELNRSQVCRWRYCISWWLWLEQAYIYIYICICMNLYTRPVTCVLHSSCLLFTGLLLHGCALKK